MMSINLDKPAMSVNFDSIEYQAMLAKLQANILRPHGRNFARHLFLRFTAPQAAVRAWIRGVVAPMVTTAADQFRQIEARRADPKFDGGMVTGFFLSASGYKHCGFDTKSFASGAFRKGMKDQSEGLFGPKNKDPRPSSWESGFQQQIDALLTVADASEDVVKEAASAIRTGFAAIGVVLTVEEGTVLRRKNAAGDIEPVEHFGYFDGISNPLFTKQDLDGERIENKARVHWDAEARLSLVLADDPFVGEADAFGSYLVYRKLGQNVRAFNDQVKVLAGKLGVSEDFVGAMAVGRFKDGTPVLRENRPSPGPEVLNDFDFQEDPEGVRCPFHAHIRKVNPRKTTPLTSVESERRRRVVRRGIPYGKPMPGVANTMETDPDPQAPRGLLFMCFQHNVEDQFEFIQRTWVDNENFPRGLFGKDTGDDPVIGQNRNEAQRWPEHWGDDDTNRRTFNFESAVALEGGEYFFLIIPFTHPVMMTRCGCGTVLARA
jgi:Dyp-type peroxidase family